MPYLSLRIRMNIIYSYAMRTFWRLVKLFISYRQAFRNNPIRFLQWSPLLCLHIRHL